MKTITTYESDWGQIVFGEDMAKCLNLISEACVGDGRRSCVRRARKLKSEVDAVLNGMAWVSHISGVSIKDMVINQQ